MSVFNWKITRGGQEIYFPEGSRRYLSVSVEQIGGDGRLDRAIDGSAIFLGDAAFRQHAVTLSCQGQTVAPVFDLWPGQLVTLECPTEFAVPGPSATLAYDPVAGSVYGVDADDRRLAAAVAGRAVTSAGAVALRFRAVMQCVVASRNADKTQHRANAGWTIRLEEIGGDGAGVGEEGDTLTFSAPGLQNYSVETAFLLSLAGNVTSTTGLPVVFDVVSGALPADLTLNSAGVISGTPTAYGVSVAVVRATSGTVFATQTIPFFDAEPTIRSASPGLIGYPVGSAYAQPLSFFFSTTETTDDPVFSLISGSLPPGLSLSGGVVSGTATAYGAFAAVIAATLPTGQSAQMTLSLYSAIPLSPTVAIDDSALQNFTVGTAYSLNVAALTTVQNSSASPVFSVSAGALPAGLALSAGGVISGTPTAAGSYAATVRATITGGYFAEQTVAFSAALPTIFATGMTLRDYDVGTAYSLNLAPLVSVANTAATPTFALVLGALPAGLSLSGGVVSGTPTNYGAFAATFSATLPSGQSTAVSVAFFQLSPNNAPDAVILGGTAQTWLESGASGSTTYDARDFIASSTLTVVESGWIEYILVGGGGGGAAVSSTAGGGGGGAGGFRRERIYLPAGTYSVTIGSGGGSGTNGTGTSFTNGLLITRTVDGGGRGGSTSAAGAAGASGGGGGGSSTTGGAGGSPSDIRFGSSGASGRNNPGTAFQAGGGGGGFGSGGTSGNSGRGDGGDGTRVSLWTVLEFCGGGGGGASSTATTGFLSYGLATCGGGGGGAAAGLGSAGLTNTGAGVGGAGGHTSGSRNGGAGGSGRAIFIVRRRT